MIVTAFRRLLPARHGAVLDAIGETVQFLSGCDLTPRTRNAVELAVEELLSNVSKYAYPAGNPGEVELTIEAGTDGIRVEVVDSGPPFDPTAAPPPAPVSLEAASGGRGLFLVRSVSRSMRYRRDGNRNITVVEFPPA